MNVRNKSSMLLLLLVALGLTTLSLTGCKKKSEPAAPTPSAEVKKVVSEAIEQTTCPVMGKAINKEFYTEYKGKKVYFCCPACKDTFEKDPEKYISKLPQFRN